MTTDHQLIIFITFMIYMMNEMFSNNGLISQTDVLFQKSVGYKHHTENYLQSLKEG